MKKSNNKIRIITIIVMACVLMGMIDGLWQPGYLIKSLFKITLFLMLPLLYAKHDKNISLFKIYNTIFLEIWT